jgi:hypothetical protein
MYVQDKQSIEFVMLYVSSEGCTLGNMKVIFHFIRETSQLGVEEGEGGLGRRIVWFVDKRGGKTGKIIKNTIAFTYTN